MFLYFLVQGAASSCHSQTRTRAVMLAIGEPLSWYRRVDEEFDEFSFVQGASKFSACETRERLL